MKKKSIVWFALIGSLLSLSSSAARAASESDCQIWGQYMADEISPTGMGMSPGQIWIPAKNPGDAIASPTYISPLTDELKLALGTNRASIQAKYDQLVLTQQSLTVQEGKETEEAAKGIGTGMMSFSDKDKALMATLQQHAEAFKREMFAYGQKGNCMSAFEGAVAKNLAKTSMQINQTYTRLIMQKDFRIRSLEKASKHALKALEVCQNQTTTPEIASKLQKEVDTIEEALSPTTHDNECLLCNVSGGARQF